MRARLGNQGTGASTVAFTAFVARRRLSRVSMKIPWRGRAALGKRVVNVSRRIGRPVVVAEAVPDGERCSATADIALTRRPLPPRPGGGHRPNVSGRPHRAETPRT